jgi:hypothetical protein
MREANLDESGPHFAEGLMKEICLELPLRDGERRVLAARGPPFSELHRVFLGGAAIANNDVCKAPCFAIISSKGVTLVARRHDNAERR